MDSTTLVLFKTIANADTLTDSAIGHAVYMINSGAIECNNATLATAHVDHIAQALAVSAAKACDIIATLLPLIQ